MKAIPTYIYILFLGLVLTLAMSAYFIFDIKQNDKTLFLNEILGTYAVHHLEIGSTRVAEELFLDIASFELDIKEEVQEKYDGADVSFDYLKGVHGAVKAIKITMIIEGESFTSTFKVNEA